MAGASSKLFHAVPMLIEDCSCHSLLLVRLLIDTFTLFPMGTVWLGCPNLGRLGIGLGFLATHMNTYYCETSYTYRYGKAGDKHIQVAKHKLAANTENMEKVKQTK